MCIKEHEHHYTILIMDIAGKKMEAVEVAHCIQCGKEKD